MDDPEPAQQPGTSSDALLVSAYLAGDRSALAAMYDLYADRIYDLAAGMLRDRHEASDVVQDTFLVAAERMGQLRDQSRLKPWLFAIARHEIYRRTKKRARAIPTDFNMVGGFEMAAPTDPGAEAENVSYGELAELVRAAACGLDERDQLVLELSVRQGLQGADLAAALGISPDQSYTVVHRMRERVDRSLGALTVARAGRKDCPDLAEILHGWDGTFSVLVRKRVARHVESCQTCERTKRKFAPLALLGDAAALAAPPDLRLKVLAMAGEPGAAPEYSKHYDFGNDGGFPRAIGKAARRGTAVFVGAAAVLILGIGGAIAAAEFGSNTHTVSLAPATTEPLAVTTTVPSSTTPSASSTEPAVATTVSATTTPAPASTMLGDPHPTVVTTIAPTDASTIPDPTTTTPLIVLPTVPTATTAPHSTTPHSTTPPSVTTAPPTATSVAPPITTAAPPAATTTAAPAPAKLQLSGTAIDLGAAATNGGITITNTGGQFATYSVTHTAVAPFTVTTPTSGNIPAGSTVPLNISFNRAASGEGTYTNTVNVVGPNGTFTITLTARVEVNPVVGIRQKVADTTACTMGTPQVLAAVTDSSGIASVTLSWSGPNGVAGSTAMTKPAGSADYAGNITPSSTPQGTWSYTVTATDTRGNKGSASATFVVNQCIG